MYALLIDSRPGDQAKLKFKSLQDAAEHARRVIIPQIAEAVKNTLDQDDPSAWIEDSKEMLELIPDLWPEHHRDGKERLERAIERWEKFAKHDNYGDTWITFI